MTIKSMCFLANPPTTTITKWKNINCNYTFDIMISWIILSLKTTSVFLTIYPFRYLPIICTSFFLALVTTLWKDTFLSSYNYIYIYIYIPIYLSIYLSICVSTCDLNQSLPCSRNDSLEGYDSISHFFNHMNPATTKSHHFARITIPVDYKCVERKRVLLKTYCSFFYLLPTRKNMDSENKNTYYIIKWHLFILSQNR